MQQRTTVPGAGAAESSSLGPRAGCETYRDRGRRLDQAVKPHKPGLSRQEVADAAGVPVERVGKMSSNENPLGPPPKAIEAMTRLTASAHEYPSPTAAELRAAIGQYLDVDPGQVVLGTGSSALFHFIMIAFARRGGRAVTLDPTFPLYAETAQVHGLHPVSVTLDPPSFVFDLRRMEKAISADTQVVFLTRPNNPTATLIPLAEVERVCALAEDVGALVISDEAYIEYADDFETATAAAFIRGPQPRCPNLIVTRTFGKGFGLGNLRVGYAVGTQETARQLRLANDKWSTGDLNRAAALGALADTEHLAKTRALAKQGREMLARAFADLGFDVVPNSQSVNIMVDVTRLRGTKADRRNVGWTPVEFADAVFEAGRIMIRGDFSPTHVRISIGTPELNARLVETARKIVQERLS